jgi:hypothetical protein
MKLQELEDKYGVRKEDLIVRAITKLIYEEVK